MFNLGTKIIIVGVSASGKSTFARKLAKKTNLPVIFMDSLMWNAGWSYIGDEETLKKLEQASLANQWIIEGYITKSARNFVFDRADTIIYLDYSPLVSSWRYIKRCLKHRKSARPELDGSPDKFDFKFLKLVWTKGEAISLNKFLTAVENQNKIVTLKSPKEAKDFLNKI